MPRDRFWLALLGVLLLAAGLRGVGLDRWAFGSDELGTFNDVGMYFDPPAEVTHPDQTVPKVIPLSMTALDAGHRLFGRGEGGSRALPAVFGVAVVGVAAVGLRRVLGPAVAVTAGVWLAAGVEPVFYSQYHRFYTLAALLAGSATVCAARSVRAGSGGWMALAALFAGLGVAAHTLTGAVFGVLLVGGAASAAAGRWRPAAVAVLGSAVAGGALLLVVLPVVGVKAGLATWTGLSSAHALFGLVAQVGWPVCVLAVPGAVLVWRRDRPQALFWVGAAGVWVGTAAVLPLVLPYHSAYVFPLSVPVFVLAAVAAAELARAVPGPAGWLVALGLPLLNLPALASYYQDGNRHDFRAAAAYLTEHAGPDDLILTNEWDKLRHYAPPLAGRVVVIPRAASPESLGDRLPPGGRLWVVCSGGRGGFEPAWQAWAREHAHLRAVIARPRFDYYEFAVWVYRGPPAGP